MRALVLSAGSLFVSMLATYLFGKVWFALYMWHLGINDPAELSEDYGGAFFQLIAMVVVFVVCLILTPIATSRISKRFFGGTKP
jgi:hypothetical protein